MTAELEQQHPQSNPLATAIPESLNALFEKDPMDLTNADVDKIVQELRSRRHLWALEEARAKAGGTRAKTSAVKVPKSKPTQAAIESALANIELDLDLG